MRGAAALCAAPRFARRARVMFLSTLLQDVAMDSLPEAGAEVPRSLWESSLALQDSPFPGIHVLARIHTRIHTQNTNFPTLTHTLLLFGWHVCTASRCHLTRIPQNVYSMRSGGSEFNG